MRTVLVVEDADQVRHLLQQAVLALGYRAETACSGQEALACLSLRRYDVVLCNLQMAGMNGNELFRICRQQYPEVADRFVFLSAFGRFAAGSLAAASGQPFLAKPCRLTEIRTVIDRVLQAPAAT